MSSRRSVLTRARLRLGAVVGVLVLAGSLGLTACSSSNGNDFTFTSANKVGTLIPAADRKPAEDVSGDLLSGGTASLESYRGKVLVLPFWASWCNPCRAEAPQLSLLYDKVKSQGVQLLGVNTLDDPSSARSFVSDNHLSYPSISDTQGKVQLQLGNIPGKLPFTVLVDKQGRVAAVWFGALTVKDLQGSIDALRTEPSS